MLPGRFAKCVFPFPLQPPSFPRPDLLHPNITNRPQALHGSRVAHRLPEVLYKLTNRETFLLPEVIAFAQQICSSVGVSLTVSASADGSASVSPSTTNTQTPTPTPSSATTTGTQGSQVVSPASSAAAATTVAMSQASETATSTSGASGRDARFGLRGMVWSGVVVGWWLFRIGA